MTKLEYFTESIQQVMTSKDYSIMIFEQPSVPKDFWVDVRKNLPSGLNWPKDLSRFFKDNKQNILNLLNSPSPTPMVNNMLTHSEEKVPLLMKHTEQNNIFTRDEIIKLINEVLDKRLLDLKESVQMIQNKMEMPPESKTIKGSGRGRKERRDYVKITPTMDRVLFNLFDAEAKKQKLSHGKLLDVILWHWYQKPKLSYEQE